MKCLRNERLAAEYGTALREPHARGINCGTPRPLCRVRHVRGGITQQALSQAIEPQRHAPQPIRGAMPATPTVGTTRHVGLASVVLGTNHTGVGLLT